MGLQDFGIGGRAGAVELGRISSAAADGGDFGFSLRDALEPAGQSVEGRTVYGCDEGGREEARVEVCAGAGRRRLHGECPAGGFAAAGCAVHICARWRTVGGGARRTAAVDRTASLCVEKREVGAWIHPFG